MTQEEEREYYEYYQLERERQEYEDYQYYLHERDYRLRNILQVCVDIIKTIRNE